MKRRVTINKANDTVGSWSLECPTCPLRKHTDALGQKPPKCASGIQTNMQGLLILSTCANYETDTLFSFDGELTLECKKEDEE